jgi:hypothetical protein
MTLQRRIEKLEGAAARVPGNAAPERFTAGQLRAARGGTGQAL